MEKQELFSGSGGDRNLVYVPSALCCAVVGVDLKSYVCCKDIRSILPLW
jgi:hypothetical protein